jgi:CPA2 family monovalent cation:H+ antiporter-2
MHFTILESMLSVFLIALFVTVVFRQLRMSVILGYLIVGAVVGPHALGLIPDSESIKELAEFGIVFLMFTVGLEFSLPKLFALRYPVFFIGGLQVLLSIAITVLLGLSFGMTVISAVIVGGVVAMSSTAIVIKQLNDQLELHSKHGLNAVGILLFQDLAVIPFIILISSFAYKNQDLSAVFISAIFKGVLAIFLIFIMGRWLLKPLFRLISKTRAIELFTLTVLLVTLISAWLTHQFGLSFALGAFLAGMMLGETEFRHQIEVEIRPFRDILLGLFFITIGMLTDVSTWHLTWEWILILLVGIIIGKLALITLLSRLSGNTFPTSLRTGLVLAQGGEFGFAILTLALTHDLIPQDYGQVILAALLISIAISPLLIHFNRKIATFFFAKQVKLNDTTIQQKIIHAAENLNNHIILCGYGRVGQHIARMLDKIDYPYIGLDLDAELVQRASLAGDNVIYGDSSHPAILKAAGIDHAKVLVISLSDFKSASKILSLIRHSHPKLPTLIRCRDDSELKKLKEKGATYVIAELFEESLTLTHHLMRIINMPSAKIAGLIQEVRNKDYDLLHKVFTGSFESDEMEEIDLTSELRPILITDEAYAINKKLSALHLKSINIEVIALRRGNEKYNKPSGDIKLQNNDILIVFGEIPALEEAERILLEGK